jgi:predicted outer membrane protein
MATPLRWTLGALAVALLIASPVMAQRPTQEQQNPQRGQQLKGQVQPGQQAQPRTTLRPQQGRQGESMADHQIATWLVLCNELEVRLAQLADKQAHSDNVKQFAKMMVDEHGNLLNQLRQFAPDAPSLGTAEQRTELRNNAEGQAAVQQQPAQPQRVPQQPGQQPQAPAQGQIVAGGLPVEQVCQQLSERALATLTKELNKKQGSDFDKAFIGSQIHEHLAMLDTLQVLRQYASPQLRTVIDEAIPSADNHLAEARKIGEQLWGHATSDQSQTGNREERQEKRDREDQEKK